MASLPLIKTGLQAVDRMFTSWSAVLNPFVTRMDSFPQRFTSRSRPIAGASAAGLIIRIKDGGSPEQMQACLQRKNGDWEWVVLGVASQ